MSVLIFTHPECLDHDPGPMHPESAARLTSILDALRACSFSDQLIFKSARSGTREEALLVHRAVYLRSLEESVPAKGLVFLDPDTALSAGSLRAAFHAVGAACGAVDAVIDGPARAAFCAVRPPGHHALPDRAMGFCLFNTVAIAARYAKSRHKLHRIAIVDFDVHHGNGTEAILLSEPDNLYVSTHQWPFYPGTGSADHRGLGNILNCPLPAGTGSGAYRTVFSTQVVPALNAFGPELILVSAGFDAHRDDPLADLMLTADDYRWIGDQLHATAHTHCGGKIVSVLEGGYDLAALASSSVNYLAAFV